MDPPRLTLTVEEPVLRFLLSPWVVWCVCMFLFPARVVVMGTVAWWLRGATRWGWSAGLLIGAVVAAVYGELEGAGPEQRDAVGKALFGLAGVSLLSLMAYALLRVTAV